MPEPADTLPALSPPVEGATDKARISFCEVVKWKLTVLKTHAPTFIASSREKTICAFATVLSKELDFA